MGKGSFFRKLSNFALDTHFVEERDLRAGDHIYCYRSWHVYSHQGIVEGRDANGVLRVIHFRDKTSKTFSIRCSNRRGGGTCFLMDSDTTSGVVSSCVDCFRKGHNLRLYHYNVSSHDFEYKRPGTCTTEEKDEASKVVERAQSLLQTNGFGEYHLLDRNCEQFALYCSTGKDLPSNQVEGVLAMGDF